MFTLDFGRSRDRDRGRKDDRYRQYDSRRGGGGGRRDDDRGKSVRALIANSCFMLYIGTSVANLVHLTVWQQGDGLDTPMTTNLSRRVGAAAATRYAPVVPSPPHFLSTNLSFLVLLTSM